MSLTPHAQVVRRHPGQVRCLCRWSTAPENPTQNSPVQQDENAFAHHVGGVMVEVHCGVAVMCNTLTDAKSTFGKEFDELVHRQHHL
jgi:hypothetical protein